MLGFLEPVRLAVSFEIVHACVGYRIGPGTSTQGLFHPVMLLSSHLRRTIEPLEHRMTIVSIFTFSAICRPPEIRRNGCAGRLEGRRCCRSGK